MTKVLYFTLNLYFAQENTFITHKYHFIVLKITNYTLHMELSYQPPSITLHAKQKTKFHRNFRNKTHIYQQLCMYLTQYNSKVICSVQLWEKWMYYTSHTKGEFNHASNVCMQLTCPVGMCKLHVRTLHVKMQLALHTRHPWISLIHFIPIPAPDVTINDSLQLSHFRI